MNDRIPAEGKAGRMLITPENGSAPFYATVTMADEPLEEGTPLNKANLLTDEAEISLFGSAENRTVNDAFMGLGAQLKLIMGDMASITVTVKDHAENPAKNVLVSGIYSETGSAVYTNAGGVASGYIAEGNQTISVTGYADLEDVSKTLVVVKGSTIAETLTPTRKNFAKFTSSQNTKFSGNVSTIDVSVVGGGAGGERAVVSGGGVVANGAGGSGGYVVTTDGIEVTPNHLYPVVIGSGGKGGGKTSTSSASTGGGSSSAFGITANGAQAGTAATVYATASNSTPSAPGAGNGIGAKGVVTTGSSDGAAGGNGKVDAYSSFTEIAAYGAGGGSGALNKGTPGAGGVFGGGEGGATSRTDPVSGSDATANTGSGGGGGAAFGSPDSGEAGIGGNGAAGVVTARIHFDFGDLAA